MTVPAAGEVVDALLARVLALRAEVGDRPVLVGVDGRSGAGKTELAAALVGRVRARGLTTAVVHLDALYPGWSGLADALGPLCTGVVSPLTRGRAGSYRSWDWHRDRPGPVVPVAPEQVVVVEGVGALAASCASYLHLRVWLEAPGTVRRARALGRDGEVFAPHWDHWAAQEEALLAGGLTAPHVEVDTVTGALLWSTLEG